MDNDSEIAAETVASTAAERVRIVELPDEADHTEFATMVANIVVSEIVDKAMLIIEDELAAEEGYNATHSEEDLQAARMASEEPLKEAAAEEKLGTHEDPLGVLLVAADLVASAVNRGVIFVGQVHAEVDQYWARVAEAEDEAAAALIMLHEQAPAGGPPIVVRQVARCSWDQEESVPWMGEQVAGCLWDQSKSVPSMGEQVAGCSWDQPESVPSMGEQVAGCSWDQPESVPLAEPASPETLEEFEDAVKAFMSKRYIPRKSKIPYRSLPLTKPPSNVAPIYIEKSPGYVPFVEYEPAVIAKVESLEMACASAMQDHEAQAPESDPLLPAAHLVVSHKQVVTKRSRNVQSGVHESDEKVAETCGDADSGDPFQLNLSFLNISDDSYDSNDSYNSDCSSEDEMFLSALSFLDEGDEVIPTGGSGDAVKVGQDDVKVGQDDVKVGQDDVKVGQDDVKEEATE